MRLSKFFGLLTFPVFRPYRSFDGQNKSGTRPLFLTVKTVAKSKPKLMKLSWNFWHMSKMSKIYRNFQHMSKMSKITVNTFDTFRSNNGPNNSKNGQKFDQKFWKWPLLTPFLVSDSTIKRDQNFRKIFDRQKVENFAKINRSSKLLPERTALPLTPYSDTS